MGKSKIVKGGVQRLRLRFRSEVDVVVVTPTMLQRPTGSRYFRARRMHHDARYLTWESVDSFDSVPFVELEFTWKNVPSGPVLLARLGDPKRSWSVEGPGFEEPVDLSTMWRQIPADTVFVSDQYDFRYLGCEPFKKRKDRGPEDNPHPESKGVGSRSEILSAGDVATILSNLATTQERLDRIESYTSRLPEVIDMEIRKERHAIAAHIVAIASALKGTAAPVLMALAADIESGTYPAPTSTDE